MKPHLLWADVRYADTVFERRHARLFTGVLRIYIAPLHSSLNIHSADQDSIALTTLRTQTGPYHE